MIPTLTALDCGHRDQKRRLRLRRRYCDLAHFGFVAAQLGAFKTNGTALPLKSSVRNNTYVLFNEQALGSGYSTGNVDGFEVHVIEVRRSGGGPRDGHCHHRGATVRGMNASAFCIEPLESRIAPAVLFVITTPKGVSITEDSANAGSSAVSFTVLANGDLVIDPTDMGTQLKVNGAAPLAAGDPFTVAGFTGGISGKLGTGNDVVALTGRIAGAVNFDLGPGTNSVTLTDAFIGGAFGIKGGGDADTVAFAGGTVELFGPVKIALGDGANVIANTAGVLSTGGDFVASAGKGVDDLLLGGTVVLINGKLDMNSGVGADDVGFEVTQLLQISKSATLKSGGDLNGSTDQTLNGGTAVGVGSVTMTVKAGTANQHVISSGGPVVISGAATFSSGAGGFLTEVKVSADSYLTVSDGFTATTKASDGELDVRARTINGRIGGAFTSVGFVSVIAEFSGAIVGPAKLALPVGGSGYVFLGTKVSQTAPLWLGAVTIAGQADSNTLGFSNTIVQGALKVKTAAGNDDFIIDDTVLLGTTTVDLGDSTDRFLIETGTTPPGTSQIFGKMLLKGGGGADTFTFGGGVANTVLRAVAQITADGGADTDTLTTGVNTTLIIPIVQLSIP